MSSDLAALLCGIIVLVAALWATRHAKRKG